MDIALNYVEKGRGTPLVLLHGNGEDHTYFRHQTAFFSRYFRVIALDTRGHGSSPRGTAPFTLRQFADDLYGFLTEHQIGRADILGFSDGGNIAMYFALKHPGSVRHLVLNGANLFPAGVKKRIQIPIVIGYRLAARAAKKSPAALKKAELLGLMVHEPDLHPRDLSALRMPVLVIAGTRDLIKKRHTELIHRSIPGSCLRFVKGGHAVAAQNPDAFNRVVLRFLRS